VGKGNEGAHSSPHSAAIWHLQQRRQYLAVPCAVKPGHACRAMPCNTVGRQARPRLRCRTSPVHAVPCRSCGANPGLPSHACLALPSPSVPTGPRHDCIALPSAALPNHACRAMPFLDRAWPRHAVPAVPSRTMPVHTTPANPILAHPSLPHLPRLTWQRHASPAVTVRGSPGLALPASPYLALSRPRLASHT
jgi:hypothetical protein